MERKSLAMEIRRFNWADEALVIELWRQCGLIRSHNDPHLDIGRKMAAQPGMFLVAILEGKIVGTVMAGYEGHRGYINYLGTSPEHRRLGIARALMQKAEEMLKMAGCPKINLLVRSNNESAVAFYRELGFEADEVISMGKRLAFE